GTARGFGASRQNSPVGIQDARLQSMESEPAVDEVLAASRATICASQTLLDRSENLLVVASERIARARDTIRVGWVTRAAIDLKGASRSLPRGTPLELPRFGGWSTAVAHTGDSSRFS